jgi:hypothetical protein
MPKTSGYPISGNNRRMTEYQAAILLNQMKRIEADTELRWANGQYLTSKIKDIPGIVPHRLYEGVTRAVYHLYPFRYLRTLQQRPSREVHGGSQRRRHSMQWRVWSPVQRRPDGGNPESRFPAGVPKADSTAIGKSALSDNDRLCRRRCGSAKTCAGGKQDMGRHRQRDRQDYENRDKLA